MRKNYCKFLKMELAVWERPVWTADWRGPVKTTWPDQASLDDATPHNTQQSVIEKPLAAPERVQRWNKYKSNNLWKKSIMSPKIRQNFHEDCEAFINKQINMEFYASYVYLSMVSSVPCQQQIFNVYPKIIVYLILSQSKSKSKVQSLKDLEWLYLYLNI